MLKDATFKTTLDTSLDKTDNDESAHKFRINFLLPGSSSAFPELNGPNIDTFINIKPGDNTEAKKFFLAENTEAKVNNQTQVSFDTLPMDLVGGEYDHLATFFLPNNGSNECIKYRDNLHLQNDSMQSWWVVGSCDQGYERVYIQHMNESGTAKENLLCRVRSKQPLLGVESEEPLIGGPLKYGDVIWLQCLGPEAGCLPRRLTTDSTTVHTLKGNNPTVAYQWVVRS